MSLGVERLCRNYMREEDEALLEVQWNPLMKDHLGEKPTPLLRLLLLAFSPFSRPLFLKPCSSHFPPCIESQGCCLIPLYYLISCSLF